MTHIDDGPLVVFLIGMRIRQWWRPDLWLPVFLAMPRMIAELSKDPDSGLLAWRLAFDLRGPWVVQYWRDTDRLYAYASAPAAAHRPAWTAFNRRARQHPDAVGVWHETFPVARAESIYVGMTPAGLAKGTGARPVTLDRAPDRLARRAA